MRYQAAMLRAIAKKAGKPPNQRGNASATVAAVDRGVLRDHLSKLEAALHELGACRRMLDAALAGGNFPASGSGAPRSASARPGLLPLFSNLGTVSQLQHSPKFGTKGFTSPDPHTIAYETGWPARSRSWGARGDRDRAFFGEEIPSSLARDPCAAVPPPDGAPKETACQPLLSSMMTTIS